jgi:hypothetical protein
VKKEKPEPPPWSAPKLNPNTPSPIFGGSTGGLLRKAQVRRCAGVAGSHAKGAEKNNPKPKRLWQIVKSAEQGGDRAARSPGTGAPAVLTEGSGREMRGVTLG